MRILTNMPAIRTYNDFEANNKTLAVTTRKLSTGQNFTNAIENPAMMGITEGFDGILKALNVAVQNAQMGKGYYDAMDNGYQQVSNDLKSLKEIVIRASNGTYSKNDLQVMSHEISALKADISLIATGTSYNNNTLLDGSLSIILQVGDKSQDTFLIQNSKNPLPATLGINTITASAAFSRKLNVISSVNSAIATLANQRADMGHQEKRLERVISKIQIEIDNYTSIKSSIKDTDLASEMIKYTSQQIIQQASQAMLAQSNVRAQNILTLFR